ncbi:MAG TPA: fused MFS/spermidine synthase [Terriglobia bacterium]
MTTRIFAPTIFLSAFLLFCFEPMIGKMMLPLLGGAAAVWITCLLFFQLMLLAGYGYALVLERYLPARAQIIVHAVMMVAVLFFLPIHFVTRPDEAASINPSGWLLWQLVKSAGIPFGIVSTTAPLLQAWLTKTKAAAARDPYFLYAISNAGSLIALVAYPLLIEPRIGVREQTWLWSTAYALLGAMLIAAAAVVWKTVSSPSQEATPSVTAEIPSWRQRLFWLAAAFVPSGLMLAVTNHILLNLASVPFLWILPLAVYLMTFMAAFGRKIHISSKAVSAAVPVVLLLLFPFAATSRAVDVKFLLPLIAVHMLILAAGALLCHTALAARRPDPQHLTEFYFWIALGGVLGGVFTAVLAPFMFRTVIEYPLLVAAIAFFREPGEPKTEINGGDLIFPAVLGFAVIGASKLLRSHGVNFTSDLWTSIGLDIVIILFAYLLRHRVFRFGVAMAILIFAYQRLLPQFFGGSEFIYMARDFFGVKGVKYDFNTNSRRLLHGDTLHGIESQDPDFIGHPVAYYDPTGPVGDVMDMLSERGGNQHVGVVGLGTGSMAGWTAPSRHITFFDIDRQMIDIAMNYFTFLPSCGKNCDVIVGDGRLSIEKANAGEFDLLMLDAFNSDSIPAHLVSREAIRMYLTKLKPDGFLLFHVSNRYMDVEALISAVVTDANLEALVRHDDEQQNDLKARSHYIVAGRNAAALGALEHDANWMKVKKPDNVAAWTDDYSNMLAILRWH